MGYTVCTTFQKNTKDVLIKEILPYCRIKENYTLSKTKGGYWIEGYTKEDKHFINYIRCSINGHNFCYKVIDGVDSFEVMPLKYLKMLDLSNANNKRYFDYAMNEINKKKALNKNYPKYKDLKEGCFLNVVIGTELNIGNRAKINKGDKVTGIWRNNRIVIPSYNAMIKKNQIKRFCSLVKVLDEK